MIEYREDFTEEEFRDAAKECEGMEAPTEPFGLIEGYVLPNIHKTITFQIEKKSVDLFLKKHRINPNQLAEKINELIKINEKSDNPIIGENYPASFIESLGIVKVVNISDNRQSQKNIKKYYKAP